MSSAARVVLLHYHLRPGGVSTVIRDQVLAVRDHIDCIVVCGEPPEHPGFPAPVYVVPELAYGFAAKSGMLADRIEEVIRERWTAPADLLHFHNPTLGKNAGFPGLARELRRRGTRVLLQIHDFAEDGRPLTYAPDYPEDCHYALLNRRDLGILAHAGLDEGGLHYLPNMVHPLASAPSVAVPDGDLLYPVRGIRRKNLGEALLLALLADKPLVLTLSPRGARERARFELWRDFARSNGFDARLGEPSEDALADRLAAAAAAVTTSVNEGFGYAFVEPWTAGREVKGRRVDHVCRDFEDAGLAMPGLYRELPVPTTIFDADAFTQRWGHLVDRVLSHYGRSDLAAAFREYAGRRLATGWFDFGRLDEEAQRETLRRCQADRGVVDELRTRTAAVLDFRARPELLRANRKIVTTAYGKEVYRSRLLAVYERVLADGTRDRVDPARLLNRFLAPEGFYPVGQRLD